MKVLILLKKKFGGVGTYVLNVKKILEKKGHKVTVIAREEDLGICSLLNSIFKIRKKVIQLEEKNRFDVIYTQDWSIAFPLLFPYPIYKHKHFCCFHGREVLFFSKVLQNIVGKIMNTKLITVGPLLKRKFQNSSLIYEGVDLEMFRPLENVERKYIGWIDKAEVISKEDLHEISKKWRIKVARGIPFERMNFFYNQCSIFISLPPPDAGFNLCWLEAMAAGVRKIIGNRYGIGEKLPITKVEEFGWEKANSRKEKIMVLIKAIENAEEYDYRKWLMRHSEFTWKAHVEKLEKLWSEFME